MKETQPIDKARVSRAIKVLGMSASVDSGQLLSDIIEEWGGTRVLAADIKKEFDQAPEGSMIRQRFFEMLQRLILANTDRDISREIDPSEFSDEELARAAQGVMGRVLGGPHAPQEDQAVVQRGVEDELHRPDVGPPPDDDDTAYGPPPDGGWATWGK